MSSLFVIGVHGRPPTWVGSGRSQERIIADLKPRDPLRLLGHWPIGSDASADLALKVVERRLAEHVKRDRGRWWLVDPKHVLALVEDVVAAVIGEELPAVATAGEAIDALCQLWDTQRTALARVARVSDTQVSRWMTGDSSPDFDALARLRAFAAECGLPWPDLFATDAVTGPVRNVVYFPGSKKERHDRTNKDT